ncbi:MAG TPA: Crp/Fnr family transcriptional regulator [Actinomycetota bacterium]|nr:Crp/Fnr family transcriptional regulator [Actinomycetota bacterium]
MAIPSITPVRSSPGGLDARSNRLLASLAPSSQARLLTHALTLDVAAGDELYAPNLPAPWVFFPLSCVVSIMIVLDDGSAVETATIGREGIAGTFQALGDDRNPYGRAVIQMSGRLLRVEASVFREQLGRDPALENATESYVRALLVHISQSVACAAAHSVKQRLARWLLQTSDRVASDEIELTHDFLAHILHVRRASVTLALGGLQALGLIATRRGCTTVLDRAGLAEQACECYARVNQEYARLIPGEPLAR